MKAFLCLGIFLLTISSLVYAESIKLKDESVIEYKEVFSSDENGVTFLIEDGLATVEWSQITSVDAQSLSPEKYNKYLKRKEEKKLFEEKQKKLGLIKHNGKWMTKAEKFALEQFKKGLVEYKGNWIPIKEKFEKEQIEKGLIKDKGNWITPEEKFEKEQIEKGLVKYNGKVIHNVLCKANPSQTYVLYLPPNYTATKSWPIVYGFSPNAAGIDPVRLLKNAAEKYGYIVVGSNNAQNGPWEPIEKAIDAILIDTETRLNLDPKKRYATGFSGGARMAFTMANRYPEKFMGIIPCGAGFGRKDYCPYHAYVYAFCGSSDGNVKEVKNMVKKLFYPTNEKVKLEIFDGGHNWPSAKLMEKALKWMDSRTND